MFDNLKKKRAIKKKNKEKKTERFVSLTANGVEAPVLNFEITRGEDKQVLLVIHTKGAVEQLHYETIDFELKTDKKMVRVNGTFREASNVRKEFKRYIFLVNDYSQFYI